MEQSKIIDTLERYQGSANMLGGSIIKAHYNCLRLCLALLRSSTRQIIFWLVPVYRTITNWKQFVRVNRMPYITHTLIWLTVYIALPKSKWIIGVNYMPYIAHTLIWLPVSVVLPHRKQFERVNRVPYIAQATKIWTVFDASSIANVLHLFWRFFTSPFAISASHTVSSKGLFVVSR